MSGFFYFKLYRVKYPLIHLELSKVYIKFVIPDESQP